MNCNTRIVLSLCLWGAAAVGAPLRNGSFEQGTPGGIPGSWHFADSKTASGAQMTVEAGNASDGRNSLLIRNPSPKRPNVFGSLFQAVPLEAGKRYRLSGDLSGAPTQGLVFIIGEKWSIRLYPGSPDAPDRWHHFSKEFTLQPEDLDNRGRATFRIVSQDLTAGTRLDNLRIDPAGGSVLTHKEFQTARVLPAKRFEGRLKPGIPAGFPCVTLPANPEHCTAKTFPKPEQLSARFAFGFDPEGILFFADIKDDRVLGGSDGTMWKSDCVQLRLSPTGSFSGDCPESDFEIGFSPSSTGGMKSWNWRDERPLDPEQAELTGGPIPGGCRFAVRLKWKLFDATPEFRNARSFSFNVIVNDSDAPGHRDVAFLADGIHHRKSDRLNTLVMKEDGAPLAVLAAETFRDPHLLRGRLFLAGVEWDTEQELTAELIDSAGKITRIPLRGLPPVQADEFIVTEPEFPLTALADGPFRLRFLLDGKEIGSATGEKADLLRQQLTFLAEAQRRFAAAASNPAVMKSRDLRMLKAILERQIAMHHANLTAQQSAESLEYRLKTGEVITREIGLVLESLETALKQPPPENPAAEAAESTLQPFIGYGHFEQVIRDLDYLPEVAANLIQIEIGPRHVFPEAGFQNPSDEVYRNRLETAFRSARKNDVKIALLLSPHYHPEWWLKAHPELAQANGMYQYDVNTPESREMVERFLDWILPKLRDGNCRDVLHSIVLANEPVWRGAKWSDARTRGEFADWLRQEFGTAAAFNAVSGKRFADFDAVLAATPADPAVNYAFQRFRRESFAAFHRMIADKVKTYLPGMPVSVKIMMADLLTPAGVDDAVDPELFADFSDYNGNDNYMMYGEGQFVSNWIQTQLGHDLQYSLKPVRILNSENHMIRDGEMRFIPPEHIYTAIFEQLLQGAGGIVSWVWARNDYAVHQRNDAVDGCIFHRPAAIAAHGRAALDGVRLAGAIAQFVEAPPEIALVYSPSSHIQNPGDYTTTLRNTFTALAFTGRKTGFISEKQLAAGKFGKLKAIVLTDVTHLDAKAAAALAKFAEQSGKLFLVGAPPAFDSWGNPLKLRLAGEQVKNNLALDESTRFWREKLADLLPLPFMLEAVGETGTTGVFFRAVSVADGEWLVNIVNYNRESRRLRLSGPGAIEDLIGGGEFAPEFTLPPLKPLLLRIRTK